MRVYKVMVKNLMMYGAEIWEWKERDELERVNEIFIRWTLGVDRRTSGYAVIIRNRKRKDLNKDSKVSNELGGETMDK